LPTAISSPKKKKRSLPPVQKRSPETRSHSLWPDSQTGTFPRPGVDVEGPSGLNQPPILIQDTCPTVILHVGQT
jgi:hypothetical protein